MQAYSKPHNFKILRNEQETLRVETIAMICTTLSSLSKFQYFRGPIHNPVEHTSVIELFCENTNPLNIFTKKLQSSSAF